jgi:WD40 repeat protein
MLLAFIPPYAPPRCCQRTGGGVFHQGMKLKSGPFQYILGVLVNAALRHLVLVVVLASSFGRAAQEPVAFVKQIAPVLREKCLTCHGPEKAKGGFRLDTFELMNKPGSSKLPPLVAGSPEKSHLFELLTTSDQDDRMPQKDNALPPDQIGLFERWIREGARFDGPEPKATLASLAALMDQPLAPETYLAPVPITAIAFHPAGKELAVSGYHEITVWSADTTSLLRRITNVAQRTFALVYHRDGTILAAASGTPGRSGEAKLFDAQTGERIRTLVSTPDVMLSVCFNADSTRLACAGTDNAIRLFDAASGNLQLTAEQHADWVTSVAFSADGSNIVSASRDKTVRVYDAVSGELETTYTGHGEAVFAAAFSIDPKYALSAGRDKKVHLWEVKDGKKSGELSAEGEIQRLIVSTNGIFVAAGAAIRHYSKDSKRELLHTFTGHADLVYGLALHDASEQLASGSYDGEIRLWNIRDGTLLRKFRAVPLRLTVR